MQDTNFQKCLICEGTDLKKSWMPSTLFNQKQFDYLRCLSCNSISINPIPNDSELELIYGVNDHDYLLELKENEKLKQEFNWPKYNHRTIQLKFLSRILNTNPVNNLLDYATGSGFYLAFCEENGVKPVGTEFSENFAQLMAEKTGFEILGQKTFEEKYSEQKFDAIHFGHILEHLEKPKKLLEWARKYAHENTLIIVDGPLEENYCLSKSFVKFVSTLKGHRTVAYEPQHFTFTNKKSQLQFFESCGLETINYKVLEQSFPLPDSIKPFGARQLSGYLISQTSIALSNIIPGWGNVFHYVGKFR